MSPAQDVAMKVRHGFTGIGSVVKDEPEAGFIQAELAGDFARFEHQMAKHGMIFRLRFRNPGNRLFGNYQHVRGGRRFDVTEGEHVLVLIHNLGRHFARDDFFEKGLAHGTEKVRQMRMDVNRDRRAEDCPRVASNKKTPRAGLKGWDGVFVASREKDTEKE